jgi:hypothetical protein
MGRALCAMASLQGPSRLWLKGQPDQILGSENWYLSEHVVGSVHPSLAQLKFIDIVDINTKIPSRLWHSLPIWMETIWQLDPGTKA